MFWGWDPLRERKLDGVVGSGGSVLLVDCRKALGGVAVGDTDERRPDVSVEQRDSAVDEPSCDDIVGRAQAVENGADLTAGRVAAPASADRLAGDLLCKIRHRAASRLQHTPVLTHPSRRIHGCGAAARTMNWEEALTASALQMS